MLRPCLRARSVCGSAIVMEGSVTGPNRSRLWLVLISSRMYWQEIDDVFPGPAHVASAYLAL